MKVSVGWGALLIGVAAATYANSFFGAFQFDDFRVIVDYPPVHSWQGWWDDLGHGLRPLLKLSYAASWQIGGGEPWAFHLLNLAIHLACTGLVYGLACAFGRSVRPERDWRPVAYLTALLFAVHPAHTEAITYVSGRSSSLMTLFYLAALLSYERWTTTGKGDGRLASLGLFGLAAATKESALMLPFALLAWEWARQTPWRTVVARQWPFWAATAVLFIGVLLHPGYRHLLGEALQQRSLLDGISTQLHGAGTLLGKLVWPAALNIDPDLPGVAQIGFVLPELLALALMLALAWRTRDRRPWISLGLVWAIGHLFLCNAFLPRTDIANERQLYWADWGLLLAFAASMEDWRAKPSRGVLALLAAGLALATIERNAVYRSEIILWQDTVAKSPGKARAHNNLGYAYELAGRRDEARQAYQKALQLDPDYTKARNNLDRDREDALGR